MKLSSVVGSGLSREKTYGWETEKESMQGRMSDLTMEGELLRVRLEDAKRQIVEKDDRISKLKA